MCKISEELKVNYIDYYKKIIKKREEFKINKKVKNILSNEEFSFGTNPLNKIKQDYNWLVFNAISLEKKHSENTSIVSIFITLTLDTFFNKYKLKNGELIYNKKYNVDNTIHQSYQILNNFFKNIYQNFKVNQTYQKLEFIKVYEPMQNFTPHLHALIFVKKEYLDNFKSYLNKKIINDKYLGRYDIQIINNIKRSSSYLLKYINKNFDLNNSNQNLFKVYYGWKLKNKIKAYSFTKTYMNRELFDRVSFYLSKQYVYNEDMQDYLKSNNYYEIVNMFTTVYTTILNKQNGEIITKIHEASEDDMFIILLSKEREIIKDINYHKIIELSFLMTNNLHRLSIIKKLKELKIFDKFNYYVLRQIKKTLSSIDDTILKELLSNFKNSLEKKYRYKYTNTNYKIYMKHYSNLYYKLVFDKENWKLYTDNKAL